VPEHNTIARGRLIPLLHALGLRRRHLALPAVRPVVRTLTQAGVIPWGHVAGADVETVCTLRCAGISFRYVLEAGDAYGQTRYWTGLRRDHVLKLWTEWAKTATRVLDIGAHTGVFTLAAAAANPRAQVIALEPVAVTFARLRANIAANLFEDRCRCLQVAAGAASATATIHLPDDVTMCSLSDRYPGTKEESVEVRCVDDLVEAPVDLVKIDVEGYQAEALRGMSRLLAHRPRFIFECNPADPSEELERIFREYGYQLFHLTADVLQPVEQLNPTARRTHDFAAIAR
jgi:FkbM family methyltransferase